MQSGDIVGATLDTLEAAVGMRRMLQACFVAGTPLLTPEGSKRIEEFAVGDWVLSRNELEEGAPVRPQRVLQVFVRLGRVLELNVGGQVLGTTAEHPFWVDGQGWVAAGELQVGDVLVSHTGDLLKVEGLRDTDDVQTMYNLEVEEDHTYFVGCADWGFSVWAHNQYAQRMSAATKEAHAQGYAEAVRNGKAPDWGTLTPKQQRAVKEHAVSKGYVDGELLHGNSLNNKTPARGYTLRDKDTSEILKYGETTLPGTTRYSTEYLKENNARMFFETSGTKREMHSWQNQKILAHVENTGERPLLNKSNY